MEKDYQIAGHRIRFEGNQAWIDAVTSLDGFKPFEVETDGEPTAYFVLTEESVPQLTESQYESGVDGFTDVFGRYKNGYLFLMTSPEGEKLSLWKELDSNIVRFNGVLIPRMVRFALWIAFGLATLPLQTIPIHTSVIEYKGRTVLFLGESGTGKSTHTRLWR